MVNRSIGQLAAAGICLLLLLAWWPSRATAGAQTEPTTAPAPAADALSARDRITFNAGLDALVVGDLQQAGELFLSLAKNGETPAARVAAALIVERLTGLELRRSAGLLPPLRPGLPEGDLRHLPALRAPAPTMRAPVIGTTTLLGLALWGWTLPTALGVEADEHPRAFVGLYMLTAASSFAGPYLLTRARPPSASQMNLIFYGGTRGAEWGLMVSNLLFGASGGAPDDHFRAYSASLLLGSVAGALAGNQLAQRLQLSPGQSRTIAALGDYGLLAGFGLGHMLGLDDRKLDDSRPDLNQRARLMAAAGLLGTGAGLVGGHWLALRRENTWGDGEVMRGAGALGALTGATVAVALGQEDSSRALVGLMLAGGGVGLLGGDRFVRTTNFTPGQALLVDLALVAGGLGGAGLVYLISQSDRPTPYLVAATLGASASGGIIALTLARHGDDGDSARRPGGSPRLALVPQFGARGPTGLSVIGGF